MPRVQIPLPIQAAESDVRPWSQQSVINAYVEAAEGGAISQAKISRVGGLSTFSDLVTSSGIRGMELLAGIVYAVAGDRLYQISRTGAATGLPGVVIAGDGAVSMAANRTQLAICTNTGDGYLYAPDGASVVESIASLDSDWLPASRVANFDDRAVYMRLDSEEYFISAIGDFGNLDALEFATAEKQPDGLVSVISDHGELWLLGETSTEVWFNSGAADFPFARIDGGVIERGCGARMGVAKEDNTVFWLGDDRTIYRANGYEPQRISTHAIEAELQGMASVADCIAWAWSEAGHKFVAFVFPTGDKAFVYDAATGRWHERRTGVGEAATLWLAGCQVQAYGKVLIGDRTTGAIYEIDRLTYTEAGEPMEYSVTTLPIYQGEERLFVAGLDANFDVGRGLTTGQGSAPEVMLTVSRDGGHTFGTELTRSLGAIGKYQTRVRWNRLGQGREMVFRLRVTDPVPVSLLDMRADVERGAA